MCSIPTQTRGRRAELELGRDSGTAGRARDGVWPTVREQRGRREGTGEHAHCYASEEAGKMHNLNLRGKEADKLRNLNFNI